METTKLTLAAMRTVPEVEEIFLGGHYSEQFDDEITACRTDAMYGMSAKSLSRPLPARWEGRGEV